jgi:hypothetical protein
VNAAAPRPVRDLAGPAAWAQWLLVAQAALAVLLAAIAIGHGAGYDDEGGSGVWLAVSALAFLVFCGGGIAVLRWIYLANANAHALGAQGMRMSPALAVGSYFIPIANLGMPFASMREIWKASSAPRDWEIAPAPAIIAWWWACWLIGNIAGAISFRLDMIEGEPAAQRAAEALDIASAAFTVPASLLLVLIIRRVTAIQREARVFA